MPTPMISDQWPRHVLPIIRKEWMQGMEAIISPAMQFFGVAPSESSVEYSQGLGNFGVIPEYNSADAEGPAAAIEYDSFNPLFESSFTHKEYAKGVAIERKLYDDEKSGLIKRKAMGLGHAFGTTRAVHASGVFNHAFATVLGADGVVLCSASHDVSPSSGTHISNLGTSALGYDDVVATILAGANMVDDRGYPMPSIYDVLYVPTALQDEAWEIVKTANVPGTASYRDNFVGGKGISHLVDPYLTDANNWFMIDTAQAKLHLLWFNRVLPSIAVDPTGDFNLVARYRGYMRYSFGWDDFRFVYGHNVT